MVTESVVPVQVMELGKALTRTMNSITVCATIHSPSPQTFDLFDKVIILLSGRIVYFGNNGERPCTQQYQSHVTVLQMCGRYSSHTARA